MTKPRTTLLRAALAAVLVLCQWTAGQAKAAAGYPMVPPGAPAAAVQPTAPNIGVAGGIVEPIN
jgi:hypothetical protein